MFNPRAPEANARVVGLIRPDAGAVTLDGHPLTPFPVHERARRGIGYLAAGRPPLWNEGNNNAAPEHLFKPTGDADIRRRYLRWRALMAEATGV